MKTQRRNPAPGHGSRVSEMDFDVAEIYSEDISSKVDPQSKTQSVDAVVPSIIARHFTAEELRGA